MDKKTKAGPKIAEIAGKIVTLLEPLRPEDRQKAIRAALIVLGESLMPGASASGPLGAGGRTAGEGGKQDEGPEGLSPKAKNWLKQYGLSMAQVEQVFSISSEAVSVIASQASGTNSKAQTHNAYVLQGVSRFLATGDTSFDDKDARKVCEDLGCFNKGNHSAYMTAKGNILTGSKKTGWKLTAPGLKHGADLVKQLSKEE